MTSESSRVECPCCGFVVQAGMSGTTPHRVDGLQARERQLYALFRRNLGRVVTYVDIAITLWPADDPERWMAAIRVYVCRLRKKIAAAGLEIRVAEDIGYRMTEKAHA